MAKVKSVYTCNECGASSPKWVGQCPSCGAWNTLYETTVAPAAHTRAGRQYGAPAAVHNLAEVSPEKIARHPTGISELDRVLGGGLVSGSVVLIGGDPGIGKSTLLTQAMATIGQSAKVLYVSGEESSDQIALRAQRLGLKGDRLRLLTENQVETILASAQSEQPQVMVVDSIQTIFTEILQSAPGSVAQVRESAAQLVRYAKQTGTALFLVGHVTQEGTRPLLVEVQALVDQSPLSNPRRVCVGLDTNRLAMLLAVLHRHAGIATYDQDVFVNVVGGVRVLETAADLAILAATVSSLRNRPLGKDLVAFGEVGLAGEVRPVQRGQERIREAAKLGFKRALVPAANMPKKGDAGIELLPVRRLTEALEMLK